MRQIARVHVIMTLHVLLAARMLGRHAHIALTCHLLAARPLCVSHPRVRNQTVRPRHSKEQQEYGYSNDLEKRLHGVMIYALGGQGDLPQA